MRGGLVAAYVCLCALAWLVTRRLPSHAMCAAYLTFMAAGELVRPSLLRTFRGTPKPYGGWLRVAFHLDYAITLGWQFFFLACCVHYFTRWRPSVPFAAWAALWMFFVLGHGRISPAASGNIYFAVWSVGILGGWICIAWGLFRRTDLAPGLAHLMLILFAATDVGTILLRMVAGLREHWDVARISAFFVVVTGVAVHARWLIVHREPARSS